MKKGKRQTIELLNRPPKDVKGYDDPCGHPYDCENCNATDKDEGPDCVYDTDLQMCEGNKN